MNNELTALIAEAAMQLPDEQYARRALHSMDLTSLGDADTDEMITTLCAKAVSPIGAVAAVCVYDRFVPLAYKALEGTTVQVATVCNFPHGALDAAAAVTQAAQQVQAGAHEVDVVLPYKAYKAGKREEALAVLRAVREASTGARLKVIIESGELAQPDLIAAASRDAIACGADFIKTSTGKVSVGATLEAAAIMLDVIRDMQPDITRPLGFKPAGGIRTVADAAAYLYLADTLLGKGWATPETFRFGASGLLNDVMQTLGIAGAEDAPAGY